VQRKRSNNNDDVYSPMKAARTHSYKKQNGQKTDRLTKANNVYFAKKNK